MQRICSSSLAPDKVLARLCRVEDELQVGMRIWKGLKVGIADKEMEN